MCTNEQIKAPWRKDASTLRRFAPSMKTASCNTQLTYLRTPVSKTEQYEIKKATIPSE